MLNRPSAIVFDLDGTLCDTDASVQAGIEGAYAEARRTLGVEEPVWLAANAEAAGIEWSANAQRWMEGELSPLDLSLRIYERTLATVGADPGFALTFVQAHAQAAELALQPYEDVFDFLTAAAERGIKLGLITNGASETQRKTLTALALDHVFEAVVISGEHGVSKPNPAVFELAVEQLGVAASSAWHVGDSLDSDVAGALAAGLGAIWLNRLGKKRPSDSSPIPTLEIASLTALIPQLG